MDLHSDVQLTRWAGHIPLLSILVLLRGKGRQEGNDRDARNIQRMAALLVTPACGNSRVRSLWFEVERSGLGIVSNVGLCPRGHHQPSLVPPHSSVLHVLPGSLHTPNLQQNPEPLLQRVHVQREREVWQFPVGFQAGPWRGAPGKVPFSSAPSLPCSGPGRAGTCCGS